MAKANQIRAFLGMDLTQFQKGLKKAENKLYRTMRKLDRVGSSMTRTITAPVLAFGAASIKSAADIDKLRKGLEGIMGSAGLAAKEFNNLREMAKNPGLDLKSAVEGSLKLQAIGYSADKARTQMEAMANAIALTGGTGEELGRVNLQFTQMIGKGKIMLEEFNNIAENMPVIRQAVKDAFGTANIEAIRDTGVTAQEFIDGIVGELGKLPKAKASISDALQNMRDDFKVLTAEIGNKLFPIFNKLMKKILNVVSFFSELSDKQKNSIVNFTLIAAAIGPLLIGLAKLVGAFKTLADVMIWINAIAMKNPYAIVAAGVVLLVAGLGVLVGKYKETLKNKNSLTKASNDLKKSLKTEQKQIDRLFSSMKDLSKPMSERQAALDEVNRLYPGYLESTRIEETNIENLATAYDKLSTSIRNKIVAEKKAAAVSEIQDKIIAIETEQVRLQEDGMTFKEKALGFGLDEANVPGIEQGEDESNFDFRVRRRIAQLALNIKSLEEESAEVQEMYDKFLTPIDVPDLQKNKEDKKSGDRGELEAEVNSMRALKNELSKLKEKLEKTSDETIISDTVKQIIELESKIESAESKLDKLFYKARGGEERETFDTTPFATLDTPDVKVSPLMKLKEKMAQLERDLTEDIIRSNNELALMTGISEEERTRIIEKNTKRQLKLRKKLLEAELAMKAASGKASYKELADLRKLISEVNVELGNLGGGEGESPLDKIGEDIRKIADIVSSVFGKMFEIVSQYYANKYAQVEKDYQAQKEFAEGIVGTERQKAAMMEEIEESRSQKIKEIKRKEAKANKAQAIFDSIINTAVAVSSALSIPPLAIAIGALGAAQTALIASQPIPALAKGGLVTGPTYAMVGDNKNAKVDPEVIAPLSKLKGMLNTGQNITVGGAIDIHGDALRMVLERADYDHTRRTGYGRAV